MPTLGATSTDCPSRRKLDAVFEADEPPVPSEESDDEEDMLVAFLSVNGFY